MSYSPLTSNTNKMCNNTLSNRQTDYMKVCPRTEYFVHTVLSCKFVSVQILTHLTDNAHHFVGDHNILTSVECAYIVLCCVITTVK